jgi:hypothetical protein
VPHENRAGPGVDADRPDAVDLAQGVLRGGRVPLVAPQAGETRRVRPALRAVPVHVRAARAGRAGGRRLLAQALPGLGDDVAGAQSRLLGQGLELATGTSP